jgi:hypothetical protein
MKTGVDGSACNRREFLGMLAAGGAGMALSSVLPPTALLAKENPNEGIWKHHVVPVDKQLSAGWRRSLYERGEPETWRRSALATIGMPIGGIAAGQLFLCGDGTLGNWEIFNDHRYLGWGPENYARRAIEKGRPARFRIVYTRRKGSTRWLDSMPVASRRCGSEASIPSAGLPMTIRLARSGRRSRPSPRSSR